MATQIQVTPDEVARTAREIDADVLKYRDSYTNVYNASDEMLGHWAGKDNQEYSKKLDEYKQALTQMGDLLTEYAIFLNRSATEYRVAHEENADRARQLPTFI